MQLAWEPHGQWTMSYTGFQKKLPIGRRKNSRLCRLRSIGKYYYFDHLLLLHTLLRFALQCEFSVGKTHKPRKHGQLCCAPASYCKYGTRCLPLLRIKFSKICFQYTYLHRQTNKLAWCLATKSYYFSIHWALTSVAYINHGVQDS